MPVLAESDLASYIPVAIAIVMSAVFAAANIGLSLALGPRLAGAVKGIAYESGMNPIGSARKRFNVRFYVVAMTFLLFDVEVIFLYPWAVNFKALGAIGFVEMVVFVTFVLAGLYYVLRKGVMKIE